MRIKTDWQIHLRELKRREIEIAFARCPAKAFRSALELGAGDGYQSTLLSRYAKACISTDFKPDLLGNKPTESIEYLICDAELLDDKFKAGTFDLVFSSSMMEHVPSPEKVLAGIDHVLEDGGIAVHILPNTFWKLTHFFLHIPNLAAMTAQTLFGPGGLYEIRRRARTLGRTTGAGGSNPKKQATTRPLALSILVPEPHGNYPGNIVEFFAFRRARWIHLFTENRFEVIAIYKGPVVSGYGFGFDRMRSMLEWLGFASVFIYVMKKEGRESRNEHYFTAGVEGKNQKYLQPSSGTRGWLTRAVPYDEATGEGHCQQGGRRVAADKA